MIVGLNAYGGTHFVVLVSGSGGNYLMRDPYITNGDNISFSAHYSMRNIFSISKVVIAHSRPRTRGRFSSRRSAV